MLTTAAAPVNATTFRLKTTAVILLHVYNIQYECILRKFRVHIHEMHVSAGSHERTDRDKGRNATVRLPAPNVLKMVVVDATKSWGETGSARTVNSAVAQLLLQLYSFSSQPRKQVFFICFFYDIDETQSKNIFNNDTELFVFTTAAVFSVETGAHVNTPYKDVRNKLRGPPRAGIVRYTAHLAATKAVYRVNGGHTNECERFPWLIHRCWE